MSWAPPMAFAGLLISILGVHSVLPARGTRVRRLQHSQGIPADEGRLRSQTLADLHSRAATLRAELEAVELAIEREEALDGASSDSDSDSDSDGVGDSDGGESPQMMTHRPSWSLLGGMNGSDVPLELQPIAADYDFQEVLDEHPDMEVGPINSFDHWDRRECAVKNAEEWRDRSIEYLTELGDRAEIPRTIHQIWIGPREPPCLWIDTFRHDYVANHPDWTFELWNDERVASLPMFNGKIYTEEKMWQCKADILRLEILWHYGGVYVDADMISVGNKSLEPLIQLGVETGFVIAYEPDTKDKPYSILGNSVIACTPHHPLILMLILYLKHTFYQKRHKIDVFAVTGPVMYTKALVDSDMPISIAEQALLYPAFHFVPNPDTIDFTHFPRCLMFQFGYTCSGLEGYVKRRNRCKDSFRCPFHSKTKPFASFRKLPAATDAELYQQVPVSLSHLRDFLQPPASQQIGMGWPVEDNVAVFITDGDFVPQVELRQKLPAFVDKVQGEGWDVLLVGTEWNTGDEEVVLFNVPPGGRPRDSAVLALIVNTASAHMHTLRRLLGDGLTPTGFEALPLFDAAGQLSLWFAAQKYPGTKEEARVRAFMPLVRKLFKQLANHECKMEADHQEMSGNFVKGFLHGQNSFEISLEGNGGVMYRSWHPDSSLDCELKTSGSKVDWMKVFKDHTVILEKHNEPIP